MASKDQEYFADGLSEELLNLLAKIPDLRVAARTSAFKFKGEKIDVQEVAQKLNVAHILEGSVRKSGNKVRITAQLIKAADGYHLWSETYDRTLDDIFVVQDDIAGEVVKALKLTLLGTTSVTRSRPVDPEAYNLALQGRFFLDRRSQQGPRTCSRVLPAVTRARSRATPRPGRACRRHTRGRPTPASCRPRTAIDGRARPRRRRWRSIPSSLTRIWRWAGFTAATTGTGRPRTPAFAKHWTWNPATPRRSGTPASRRLPSDAGMKRSTWRTRPSSAIRCGRPPTATSASRCWQSTATRRPRPRFARPWSSIPTGPSGIRSLGLALLLQGKTDAALQEMQQETEEIWRLSALPLAFHALGRRSESDAALAALKSKYAGEMAYQIAEVHAFRGEADLAFEWLERAYDQRDGGVADIKGDRLMRGLVGDPRYKAFLRKLKLPE